MSYQPENSPTVDQSASTLDTGHRVRAQDGHVRFICCRCHNDVGWVPPNTSVCPICGACPLAQALPLERR